MASPRLKSHPGTVLTALAILSFASIYATAGAIQAIQHPAPDIIPGAGRALLLFALGLVPLAPVLAMSMLFRNAVSGGKRRVALACASLTSLVLVTVLQATL